MDDAAPAGVSATSEPGLSPSRALGAAAAITALAVVAVVVSGDDAYDMIARAVIGVTAAVEGILGVQQFAFTRRFLTTSGRPYVAAYHDVVQDAGLYNLGLALALALAAFDPTRARALLAVVLALYLVHGTVHLLRYAGVQFGREPFRAREVDLVAGCQLLLVALALALFYPY